MARLTHSDDLRTGTAMVTRAIVGSMTLLRAERWRDEPQ